MSNEEMSGPSKRLSWLLRHGAGEAQIDMDPAGWASVSDVLRVLHMNRSTLLAAVERNNKSRLELKGGRIRACQGHSLNGMPVTLEGLEASWEEHLGDEPLWHGTRIRNLEGIARYGLLAGGRTHVHLAEALDSVVGKRAAVDVMIEISPALLRKAGVRVYRSPNGVVLVREAPRESLVGLRAMTEQSRRKEADLQASFATALAKEVEG